MPDITPDALVSMYREMLRIRKLELHIEALYQFDEMKTPVHLCIGQEAVSVGVCAALEKADYISSNHRGHGHYLAKGGDMKKMVAEFYCKATGCSHARGGSMHLVDTSVGHMGSSSIVGGGIPIAVGLALAIKQRKEKLVSVVFFGDGAHDEGVLYESVNFAMLKRLPVIFVFENNRLSVCSHVEARKPGESLFHGAPKDLMPSCKIDGNDVAAVRQAAEAAVERARSAGGASFIECDTYRIRPHAGTGSDATAGYRTEAEISDWLAKCPVERAKAKLLNDELMTQAEHDAMEEELKAEILEAFEFGQNSPLPPDDELEKHLFKE